MIDDGQQSRVARIVAVVQQAGPDERLAGMAWYGAFSKAIGAYGMSRGLSREQSLAIFAALSPQARIQRNWDNFTAVCRHHDSAHCVAIFGHQMRKIAGILSGSMSIDEVVSGDKVGAFYANLAGDMHRVTIDRHAVAVAEGQAPLDPKLSCTAYRGYEQAYQAAAILLGITPAQTQAIAWVVWRRMAGNTDLGGMALLDWADRAAGCGG